MNQAVAKNIVFIDSQIYEYEKLLSSINANTEIVILDSTQDGIEQITNILKQRQNITSVQIISHGSEGQVQLVSTFLNTETIAKYRQLLEQWGAALTDDADILLFGCEVASGEGQEFLRHLSEITGADIAASTDITGNANLGGNWDLEVQTGNIESSLGLPTEALTTFNSVLGNVGEGLLGAYFDNNSLNKNNGAKFSRIDETVNFDWGFGKADDRLTQFDFSAEWTGRIISNSAGNYTFYITSDDGATLDISKNGSWVRVIDRWGGVNNDVSGTIYLEANTAYFIQANFRDTGGNAAMKLSWQPPGENKSIIPATRLIPDTDSSVNNINVSVPTVNITGVSASESSGTAKFTIKSDIIPTYPDGSKRLLVTVL